MSEIKIPVTEEAEDEAVEIQIEQARLNKTFAINLKSHAPGIADYEDEIEAESREEALEYWAKKLSKYGWEKEMLIDSIEEID